MNHVIVIGLILDLVPAINAFKVPGEEGFRREFFSKSARNDDAYVNSEHKSNLIGTDIAHTVQLFYNAVQYV